MSSKRFGISDNRSEFTGDVLKRAKPIYRQMLTETTDVGSNNPMAGNIYMAFVYLAVWRAADGKISLEEYRQVATEFIRQPIIQKAMGGKDINRPQDMEKLKAMLYKNADWIKEHPEYEQVSWDFNFDEKKHREQTLASGGKMCDYWFVPDRIKDPR